MGPNVRGMMVDSLGNYQEPAGCTCVPGSLHEITSEYCETNCQKQLNPAVEDDCDFVGLVDPNICETGANASQRYCVCTVNYTEVNSITGVGIAAAIVIPLCVVLLLVWAFWKRAEIKAVVENYQTYGVLTGNTNVAQKLAERPMSLNAAKPVALNIIDSRYDLNLPEFEVFDDRKIGVGEFSEVFQGIIHSRYSETHDPGQSVAAKVLKLGASDDDFVEEVLKLYKVGNHEHVLGLVGYYWSLDSHDHKIFTAFMNRGSVEQYLRRPEVKLTLKLAISYLHQIADGLGHLHTCQIIHGDLAARNILIDSSDIVKIADFGLSETAYQKTPKASEKERATIYLKASSGLKEDERLPIRWTAPEVLKSDIVAKDIYTDTWSYGVVMWEVLTKSQIPYANLALAGQNQTYVILNFLEFNGRLQLPKKCPVALYYLLLRCHIGNGSKEDRIYRPSMKQIKEALTNFENHPENYAVDLSILLPGGTSTILAELESHQESITRQQAATLVDNNPESKIPFQPAPVERPTLLTRDMSRMQLFAVNRYTVVDGLEIRESVTSPRMPSPSPHDLGTINDDSVDATQLESGTYNAPQSMHNFGTNFSDTATYGNSFAAMNSTADDYARPTN